MNSRVLLWGLKIFSYIFVLHVVALQASFTHYYMTKKTMKKGKLYLKTNCQ